MSPQPQATPAPIHDIVAPVSFLQYPPWIIALAAIAAIALVLALGWFFFLRSRRVKPLTARQRAFAALEKLRGAVASTDPFIFAVTVSDVLRRFVEEEFGIRATTQTSIEFLESLRASSAFSDEERGSLAAFLDKADLIKFAHVHATPEDCADLLAKAGEVVKKQAAPVMEAAAK